MSAQTWVYVRRYEGIDSKALVLESMLSYLHRTIAGLNARLLLSLVDAYIKSPPRPISLSNNLGGTILKNDCSTSIP